jgi:alpha-L-fucosidase
VNEEFKPFENKLISRQKLIESRILKNEQNYWNFLDQYQNDMKKFSQEIEVLKNVLTTLTKANTLPVDELKIQLNEYIHSVEPKIIYFDDTINKLLNKTNSFEYQANMKKASESGMSSVAALSSLDSENEFKKMIVLSRELKEENNILNNKVTWMISISIISFLAAAIALVMRFI